VGRPELTKTVRGRRFYINLKPPLGQKHIQKLHCQAAVEVAAHGKQPTHGGGAAAIGNIDAAAEVPDIVNTPHYVKVVEAVRDITAHPMFADILNAEVLKLGDNSDRCGKPGYGLPLTKNVYAPSMKSTGFASCCSNFFDQDWKFTSTPGVPVNSVAVQKIADRDFREPTVCPMIKVAAESPTWDPTSCRGAWRRITPEEVVHAYIMAIARDVRNPNTTEDRGIQKRRNRPLGKSETGPIFG
jgi:hypothetical protein